MKTIGYHIAKSGADLYKCQPRMGTAQPLWRSSRAAACILLLISISLSACEKDLVGTDSSFFIKYYGGPEWDAGVAVQQTSDGGYLLLGTKATTAANLTEIVVLKVDTAGNTVSELSLGDGQAAALEPRADGSFVLVGTVADATGGTDMLVAGVGADASLQWRTTLGQSGIDEQGISAIERADGGLVIVGKTRDASGFWDAQVILASATGSAQIVYQYGFPNKNESGKSAYEVKPNIFLICGEGDGNATGKDLFALSIISPQQSIDQVWRWQITGDQACVGLAPLGTGDYLVLGLESTGSASRLVNALWDPVSLDSLRPIQAFSFGAYGDFFATSLHLRPSGGSVLVAGYTQGLDFAVLELDSTGAVLGQQSYPGRDDERAYGVVGTIDGGFGLFGTLIRSGTGMMMMVRDRATLKRQ